MSALQTVIDAVALGPIYALVAMATPRGETPGSAVGETMFPPRAIPGSPANPLLPARS
jgi:hypothetical protein